MNSSLSINDYDRAEETGIIDLSFSEIMAFSPTTFESLGFPTRVRHEKELLRYADWNRDKANQDYFTPGNFLRGPSVQTDFTPDEAEIINAVCDDVETMTGTLFGRPVRPLCNPLAMIGLFRVVEALSAHYGGRRFRILEIGPGSGYLSAFLIKAGHTYASMDNTQSLYLWQNRLLNHLAGDALIELAGQTGETLDGSRDVVHIPWWTYLKEGADAIGPIDIVISNANLGEMRHDALLYALAMSKRMMQETDVQLFLFASIGFPRENSDQSIDYTFVEHGYERLFSRNFYCWAPVGITPPLSAVALEKTLPLYNPSNSSDRLAAGDFMRMPADSKPLDLGFTETIEGWTPPIPD